ncbi:MAG TPA: ribosome assembly RNA-binding protein YhbY [Verrucomicrobiales bacterium]|nr:ribosome assembly RNA-binding protein YhbY [Verrucomicrobiales bacterium]HIL68392.1 ribosome assembly RNA-binding protein YhbY [Verrucomicrobiota bacterium]
MISELTQKEKKRFKAQAQRLKPVIHVGKAGLSDPLLKSVDEALDRHSLIKVKFADFKDQRKELAPVIAEKSRSHLITLLGNVLVLYRRKKEEDIQ